MSFLEKVTPSDVTFIGWTQTDLWSQILSYNSFSVYNSFSAAIHLYMIRALAYLIHWKKETSCKISIWTCNNNATSIKKNVWSCHLLLGKIFPRLCRCCWWLSFFMFHCLKWIHFFWQKKHALINKSHFYLWRKLKKSLIFHLSVKMINE